MNVGTPTIEAALTSTRRRSSVTAADQQHFAWLARTFGRTDYLPLTPADLEALSTTGKYVEKYPGTHLFREGETARHAFVIERGEIELYRSTGGPKRIITRVGEGTVLGDIAMFQEEPYISSAKAITKVRAFRFDRDKLLPVLVKHPVVTLRWLVAGLSQLEATQRRVLRLMHRTVKEQVAEMLLDEADPRGEVHISQGALAMLLGASRQTVNEALAELKEVGAAETGYRLIRVLDSAALAEAAGRAKP
jgi:CRP-like cAMP-binding protein